MDHPGRPRANTLRVRSHSSDRHSLRSSRHPATNDPELTSPVQDGRAISTRDYASPSPPRRRTRQYGFGVPSMTSLRHRFASMQSPSPNPSMGFSTSWRGFLDQRHQSVAVGAASVHDADTASRKFSVAGPTLPETLLANQTYVDPGYVQLNPAYDQPANVRPVWSLAKPLPHVLRPGMVPAKDEIRQELQKESEEQDDQADHDDLEVGRIEPTLKPAEITSQLDRIRQEREISLFRAFQQFEGSDAYSPYGVGRKPSETATEIPDSHHRHNEPETIEEETESDRYSQQAPPDLELPHLSEAIAGVRQAREEEEMKSAYETAIPLPAYDAEDDEIHNLHTYWSVIRLRFREPLAEFLAVLVMDTIGICSNVASTVSGGSVGTGDVDWAWGIGAMLAIYIAGGVSGAHLNPAMSTMLCIYRGFPVSKLPVFAIAQVLGSFSSALIAYGLFQPAIKAMDETYHLMTVQGQHNSVTTSTAPHFLASAAPMTMRPPMPIILASFITYPRQPWVTNTIAYFTEVTSTAVLTVSVLALGDDANAPPGAGMNAFIVGLLVVGVSIAFAYQTGLAMNPIRDFGPRVAMYILGYGRGDDASYSLFSDGYWFKVAWLGPFSGTILGGFLYDAAIFVGGESPVNYPAKRIKRAARKWKTAWRARFERMRQKMRFGGRVRRGVADGRADRSGGGGRYRAVSQ